MNALHFIRILQTYFVTLRTVRVSTLYIIFKMCIVALTFVAMTFVFNVLIPSVKIDEDILTQPLILAPFTLFMRFSILYCKVLYTIFIALPTGIISSVYTFFYTSIKMVFTIIKDTVWYISINITNTLYHFTYFYYGDLLFIITLLLVMWGLIINKTFRVKFTYFIALLLLVVGWGIFYSFDGIMLMFIVAEFLIILLFLLMYVTLTFELEQAVKTFTFFKFYFVTGVLIYCTNFLTYNITTFIFFTGVYQQIFDIISVDFFLFFYFFFLMSPQIVIFITLLLGLFSIFFILFYFTLKFEQQNINLYTRNFSILRKQQLIHQANYKTPIVNFQK